MMNKTILCFLLSVFLLSVGNAQEDKEFLRSIFKNMGEQGKVQQPDQTFYMSYSLHTVNVDSLQKPTDATIQVWKKNKLIEIKSAEMNVFQDEKDAFIVLPHKKLILRNDAALKQQGDASMDKYLALYDSLLNYSRITKNIAVKSKGYDRQISIEVDEKGQYLFKIKKADYFVNTTTRSIKKVRMYYGDSFKSSIAYVDYLINDLEYNYKRKHLSDNVETAFLTNNKLKENFKGYKLIDNRASVKKREKIKE
jgi:hypothetical protein